MLTYRTEAKEVSSAAKRWSWIVPPEVDEQVNAQDKFKCKRVGKEYLVRSRRTGRPRKLTALPRKGSDFPGALSTVKRNGNRPKHLGTESSV